MHAHRHVIKRVIWIQLWERGKRALPVDPSITMTTGDEEYITYTTIGAHSILRAVWAALSRVLIALRIVLRITGDASYLNLTSPRTARAS